MFPQGYVLAGNASIPYWATINRTSPTFVMPTFLTLHLATNWTSELFDIGQAAIYANQSDSLSLTPTELPLIHPQINPTIGRRSQC